MPPPIRRLAALAACTAVVAGAGAGRMVAGAATSGRAHGPLAAPVPAPADAGVRGWAGDLWADAVLGQSDFTEVTPFDVVPFKLFNPGGLAVDRRTNPGHLYVWDSGNSRVLGIDLATCAGADVPCAGSVVLGQPGLDRSACNGDSGFTAFPQRRPPGADTLCGIPEDAVSVLEHKSGVALAVDQANGRLYVPDFFNQRVLGFTDPFASDAGADRVWGQADFTGAACNRGGAPAADTLCLSGAFAEGAGAALDAAGNLWLADGGNHRVLRFPARPGSWPAPRADLVIGQESFAAAVPGAEPAQLRAPASVAFAPDGRLFVTDRGNHRVLAYNPPFRSGMAGTPFGRDLRAPEHVAVAADGVVWIDDTGNGMLEAWTAGGDEVLGVAGRPAYEPDGNCLGPLCPRTGSFDFDAAGNVLVAAYGHVQDVVVLRPVLSAPGAAPGAAEEVDRLFSPPGGYNYAGAAAPVGLGSVWGLAVADDQVIAAEPRRMLYWTGLEGLTSGRPADGVVPATGEAWQMRIAADNAGHLFSLRAGVIEVYDLPLTASTSGPASTIDTAQPLPVLGGGSLTLGRYLHGLAPVGGGEALWLADPDNNRVVRVRRPLDKPVVDVVLGQTSPDGVTCNRGLADPPKVAGRAVELLDVLCHPGAVALDHQGYVYVADHTVEAEGNWRMLAFRPAAVTPSPSRAVFAPAADKDKVFPYRTLHAGAAFEPAFDASDQMVVGFNPYLSGRDDYGRFLYTFAEPLPESQASKFKDYMSLAWSTRFDAAGNLYVADPNRHRVLVYWDPLGALRPHRGARVALPILVGHGRR